MAEPDWLRKSWPPMPRPALPLRTHPRLHHHHPRHRAVIVEFCTNSTILPPMRMSATGVLIAVSLLVPAIVASPTQWTILGGWTART